MRDIFAIVKNAPLEGSVQIQLIYNGSAYCDLTIPDPAALFQMS